MPICPCFPGPMPSSQAYLPPLLRWRNHTRCSLFIFSRIILFSTTEAYINISNRRWAPNFLSTWGDLSMLKTLLGVVRSEAGSVGISGPSFEAKCIPIASWLVEQPPAWLPGVHDSSPKADHANNEHNLMMRCTEHLFFACPPHVLVCDRRARGSKKSVSNLQMTSLLVYLTKLVAAGVPQDLLRISLWDDKNGEFLRIYYSCPVR